MAEPSMFEALGGEPGVRRIVNEFVDRLFDDVMIGFMFQRTTRERVKDKEYEFAAGHLGGAVRYTGRPLREAHAAHRIQGGQFNRRRQILKETLEELGVPEAIRRHWLEHTESLRGTVTVGPGDACDPTLAVRSAPPARTAG